MANSIPKIVYNAGAGDVTIQFQYPPQGLDYVGKTIKFIGQVSESSNGNYQTSDNYTEDERTLRFRQVKESIKNQLETFMLTFAGSKRKTFKYFVDSDEVSFIQVQMSRGQTSFRPKRTGWNSAGDFTYEIKFKMRRVL